MLVGGLTIWLVVSAAANLKAANAHLPTLPSYLPTYLPTQKHPRNHPKPTIWWVGGRVDNMDGSAAKLKAANALRPTAAAAAVGPHPRRTSSSLSLVLL